MGSRPKPGRFRIRRRATSGSGSRSRRAAGTGRSRQGATQPQAAALPGRVGNSSFGRLVSRQEIPEDEQVVVDTEPPEQERDEFEPDPGGVHPQGFVSEGRVGTVPVGGDTHDDGHEAMEDIAGVPHTFKLAKRVTGAEAEGPAEKPRAFIDADKTGTVTWAGGGGAGPHGNQNTGSIQVHLPPVYQSRSNGIFSDSDAWVASWSARTLVIRSWVGSNAGDQGNGWYVTPAAAARLDAHERLHVASTRGHYENILEPLTEQAHSTTTSSYLQSDARDELKSTLGWEAGITAFQAADQADNNPMATVDTNDLASGTYVVNIGPGTVGGTAYPNRLKTPGEAAPT